MDVGGCIDASSGEIEILYLTPNLCCLFYVQRYYLQHSSLRRRHGYGKPWGMSKAQLCSELGMRGYEENRLVIDESGGYVSPSTCPWLGATIHATVYCDGHPLVVCLIRHTCKWIQ